MKKIHLFILKNVLYDTKERILLEEEPLDIFKDCIQILHDLIKNPKKVDKKYEIKNITKLYCLGYIKTYCFIFIKMFDAPKFKEPEKIIDVINDNNLKKLITLFIFKIFFNTNQTDVFLNPNSIKKYKLEKYEGFKDFINSLKRKNK